jgi:RNA recognition motif-containing protein
MGLKYRWEKTCFISNIPYDVRWTDLKDLFRTRVGDVLYCEVFERDGKSLGVGTMEFRLVSDARRAIELMNQYEMGGRKLGVRLDNEGFKTRQAKEMASSGGGGGGGNTRGKNDYDDDDNDNDHYSYDDDYSRRTKTTTTTTSSRDDTNSRRRSNSRTRSNSHHHHSHHVTSSSSSSSSKDKDRSSSKRENGNSGGNSNGNGNNNNPLGQLGQLQGNSESATILALATALLGLHFNFFYVSFTSCIIHDKKEKRHHVGETD